MAPYSYPAFFLSLLRHPPVPLSIHCMYDAVSCLYTMVYNSTILFGIHYILVADSISVISSHAANMYMS